MRYTIMATLGAIALATPALAQAPAPTMNPATKDAVGGNSSQLTKPVPNQGQTAGGPSTRGGSGSADVTGTVKTAPMAAPNRATSNPAAGSNASQPAKPTPNMGNVSGGPAASK